MSVEFTKDLPRLSEIRKIALELPSANAFFRAGDDKFTNPNKRGSFVEIERDLQGLDAQAWLHLKSEIGHRLNQKDCIRGWQQLIDILNEAKGYNYLSQLGCAAIEFIPRAKTKTPDLRAKLGEVRILCDVKTINVSDDEARRRDEGGVGTTLAHLPEGFFKKLSSALGSASSQMRTVEGQEPTRRIAYVVVNSDDQLNECADDYRRQIEDFLTTQSLDIEVVLDIRSSFSAVRVRAV
jgi:hypothetical protein